MCRGPAARGASARSRATERAMRVRVLGLLLLQLELHFAAHDSLYGRSTMPPGSEPAGFGDGRSQSLQAAVDDAIAAGDHQAEIRTQNRVFADAEDGIDQLKRKMAEESGLEHHIEEEEDENYYVDDDDIEWWKDDEGYWWYREPGEEEWQPHEE